MHRRVQDLTLAQVGYTVDVDDAPYFQSVDFSVRSPAVWPHSSVATPISIALGGLPLNTPLYIRIRASNQVSATYVAHLLASILFTLLVIASTDWPGPPPRPRRRRPLCPPAFCGCFCICQACSTHCAVCFCQVSTAAISTCKVAYNFDFVSLMKLAVLPSSSASFLPPLPTAAAVLRTLHHRMFSASLRAGPALG